MVKLEQAQPHFLSYPLGAQGSYRRRKETWLETKWESNDMNEDRTWFSTSKSNKGSTCEFPSMTCWRVLCGNCIMEPLSFHQLVLLKRSLTTEFLTAAKINPLQLSSLISYLGFYHLTFFPSHLISVFTWMSSCWKSITENYVGKKKIMLLSAPDVPKWAKAQYFF